VDGVVEYHLGGTADAYLTAAPSKLMFDFVRSWAKFEGADILNLGGGVGSGSGPLLHFKAGFSRSRADYHTCRVTIDETRYAALVEARRAALAPNVTVSRDFFPEYRVPETRPS